MVTVLDGITDRLSSGPLTDVQVAGFVLETPARREFHHRLIDVYLQIGPDGWLRCSSIEQYSKLQMSLAEGIALDFSLPDDAEYAVSSIAALCLEHPHTKRPIEFLTMVASDAASAQAGVVECASFGIQGGDCLFLDPWNLFGVQIGGCAAYTAWLREFREHEGARFEVVWRRGADALTTRPLGHDIPSPEDAQ
jgi:hypothetical protein